MNCKVCGGEIFEGADFCTHCGVRVENGAASSEPPTQEAPTLPPPQPVMAAPRPHRSRTILWSLLAVVLVIAIGGGVAAYLLTRGDDTKITTSETAAIVTLPTTPTTEWAGRQPGILAVGITEPESIDPLFALSAEELQIADALFDSLTKIDPVTGEVLPAAAESWESGANPAWKDSPDGTLWTFHLVEGATFHNGQDVTAEDFVLAWQRVCWWANNSWNAHLLEEIGGYEMLRWSHAPGWSGADSGWQVMFEATAVDKYTLQVTLLHPDLDFPALVAHPALGPVPNGVATLVWKYAPLFTEQPIGNGPFMMLEPWAHNNCIRLVRFDNYYGEQATPDGLDFVIFLDEAAADSELQAGNVDLALPTDEELAAALGD